MAQQTTTSAPARKEAGAEFMRLLGSGQVREAFRTFVGPGFRHHNPYFGGDAESLIVAIEENAAENPDKVLEIKHVLHDGDLVAVHARVRHKPRNRDAAVVHILRFHGDRIVEMWDVGQEMPENSPNKYGMF